MKILSLTLTVLTSVSMAQNHSMHKRQPAGYTINGQFAQAANCVIYLKDKTFYQTPKPLDSTRADAQGRFRFTGTVEAAMPYQVIVNKPLLYQDFILENAVISMTSDSARHIKIGNSRENFVMEEANRLVTSPLFRQQREEAEDNVQKAAKQNDTAALRIARLRRDEILIKQNQQVKEFISKYPSACASVNILFILMMNERGWPLADSLLKDFEKRKVQRGQVAYFRNQLQTFQRLTVGKQAPDFRQQDVNGNWVTLSAQRGKYVLIDFWASWCGPCRQSNPSLVALYEKYKANNFTILSISLDDDRAKWLKAIAQDKMTWQNLSDLKGWDNAIAQQYAISSVPATFLVNPEGKITAVNLRDEELAAKLQEVIKP